MSLPPTLIEQLARFATDCRHADIPADVVHEYKRIVLDSLGDELADAGALMRKAAPPG